MKISLVVDYKDKERRFGISFVGNSVYMVERGSCLSGGLYMEGGKFVWWILPDPISGRGEVRGESEDLGGAWLAILKEACTLSLG